MGKLNEKNVDLEGVLGQFKLNGWYHMRFMLLIGLLCAFSAAHSTNYIFAVENVDYRCKYHNCVDTDVFAIQFNSTVDGRCKKYDLYDGNETCPLNNINVHNFTACNEWVYAKPDSFVAEFNLGCQDWKRTLVGTIHSAGYMVGLLFMGALSDKFGRKHLIIFTGIVGGVIGLTKSMVTSYWLYVALEFLEPMIGESYSPTYTLAIEIVTKENRVPMISIISLYIGLGQLIKVFLAWSIPNWRYYLRFLYGPCLIFILYIYVLDESVRWLLNKGRKGEVKKIFQKAAKMNKVPIDLDAIDAIQSEEADGKADLRTLLKLTFTSKKLLMRVFTCICMWFTALFSTYSLSINAVSLEGNRYLNYALMCLSEIPATFILYFMLQKCKRKVPLILSLTFTGAFCIAQAFTPREYRWLSTFLFIGGKVNASVAIRTVYLYTSELFPTYTRNTLHAMCSSFGRIACILAPQTPLLILIWPGLPSLLVGIMSLSTACLVTFMPDTSEDVLPDNIRQAEELGKKENTNLSTHL